ncbi:hypothetical protein ACFLZV_05105, partial [Candidatus Margulisiibacteriota bacterium]
YAVADLSSYARTILDDTDAATARTTLGAQASDPGLTSISGLTTDADKMIYTTASDTYAVADLSSYARTVLDDTDAATARTTLGVGTGDSPQFTGLTLTDQLVGATATFSGTVSANKFVGDGSDLSGITASVGDGTITNAKLVTGSFTAITGVGVLTDQLVGATATFSGTVSANRFAGDGSALTNLTGASAASFGEMYEAGGSSALTGGAGYEPWTTAGTGLVSGTDYVTFSAGATGTDPDQLVVGANGGGTYIVKASLSFTATTKSTQFWGRIFKNGVAEAKLTATGLVNTNTGGSITNLFICGLLSLSSGDTIDLRLDTTNTNLTLHEVNVSILRVGS